MTSLLDLLAEVGMVLDIRPVPFSHHRFRYLQYRPPVAWASESDLDATQILKEKPGQNRDEGSGMSTLSFSRKARPVQRPYREVHRTRSSPC